MDLESNGQNTAIWVGLALGAAVGIGIALSLRKRNRWDTAGAASRPGGERIGDRADSTRDPARAGIVCAESRKVVEDTTGLWQQGRNS